MLQQHKKIIEEYLDYVNNYLTVEKFAEHRGISVEYATSLITEGRTLLKYNKEIGQCE